MDPEKKKHNFRNLVEMVANDRINTVHIFSDSYTTMNKTPNSRLADQRINNNPKPRISRFQDALMSLWVENIMGNLLGKRICEKH